jgi:predicted Zn-dependent peptidase
MMGRESAFRRCESAARQLLVFDRVIDPSETIKQIDAVSKETVETIAKQIVGGPITISSIGPIKKLESLEKIQSRLN